MHTVQCHIISCTVVFSETCRNSRSSLGHFHGLSSDTPTEISLRNLPVQYRMCR